ncbi:MAG: NUDIX domain-containing protein [Acholeplasmataceae bacterium]|jgi:8-oxo-dGTP pyrophosphatase MutT (NUDIX family)|nr:NUDIX domain-containing protein [Acholeplasmataceae bacterium]
MTKEKSCGAVIFRKHQDKYQFVLIQQRYGLHFGFPKGHVEKNESERMTAKREVKEETGLDIEIFDQVKAKTSYSPKRGVIKDVVYFLAKALSFDIKPQEEEIAHAVWVDASDVLDHLTYPNDKKLFLSLSKKVMIDL